MKLKFDEHGFLIPPTPIETTLDEFESESTFNEHRRWLFNKLLWLMQKLIWLEIEDQIMLFWVNGSFATKKEFPKDIDIVTFINHNVFEQKLTELRNIKSQLKNSIDFYFEPYFPPGHRLHEVFLILKNDWQNLYSNTRRNPTTRQIHQKGFLQIATESIF